MKLIVLAGAKKDAAVPLKKDLFVIGRAEGCSLRAGSSAISRKHCEISRTATGVIVRDLGSRNGTLVNKVRIDGPTALSNGDTLQVGPLEFRFESEAKLDDTKAPKVANVADAVARANKPSGLVSEDDVSDWLLTDASSDAPVQAFRETQTFSVDETQAIAKELATPDSGESAEEKATDEKVTGEDNADTKDSKKKKEPGKLPKFDTTPKSKDSREAAMQILRDMARRR